VRGGGGGSTVKNVALVSKKIGKNNKKVSLFSRKYGEIN
jgi:hypothetical protein